MSNHDDLEVRKSCLTISGEPLSSDLIWPLGFGRETTFFDRMQLLKGLPEGRFITTPDALMYLHGKHRWLKAMPETHTSTRLDYLSTVIASGGDWIVKPTAGSYGRDVHLVRQGQPSQELLSALHEASDQSYLIVQRFVPEIEKGEKRTLIAAGRIIGSYLRVPMDGQISNVATGGRICETDLTQGEIDLIEPIALQLGSLGVGFAAIDTVAPYLMEVNVANPGGLASIESLTGFDLSDQAVALIVDWRTEQPR